MGNLFSIETDKIKLTWGSARGKEPSALAGTQFIPGRLLIIPRRQGIQCKIWRRDLPIELASDIHYSIGPKLYEQTDYKLYLSSIDGSMVTISHRDPVILKDLSSENHGQVVHGYINYGSQVGRSSFSVSVNGVPEFDFEVEVFPTKLDYASDYEQLLAEVQEILGGLALEYLRSTYHMGKLVHTPQPTHLEWLVLLQYVAEDLEKALRHIAQRPVRGLTREPVATKVEKIRRVDSSVRSAVRRGAGIGGFVPLSGGTVRVREQLLEGRARPTLDTPEHRWLSSQLRRIIQRLGLLRKQEAIKGKSARRTNVLEELARLEARMVRLSTLEPMAEAKGSPPPGFASLQLIGAPGYREAYRACLVLTMGLRLEGGPVRLSVKDLSLLYEYWCYIALMRVISEETNQPVPTQQLFNVTQQGLQVQLQKGKTSSVKFKTESGRKITLSYNQNFKGEAILVPQQPDMVLSLEDDNWPLVRLVLDAKYRVDSSPEYLERYKSPGPPEDALNIMYRYRDAIVENIRGMGEEKRVKHTVIQAAAAFPYREEIEGQYGTGPLWKSLEHSGVGAVPVLPGSTEYLRQWVHSALKKGGWNLADKAISHRSWDHAQNLRLFAAEPVLIGVLRPGNEAEHLNWILENCLYYMPVLKTQRRQYLVKYLAIYSPTALRSPGAITHLAEVKSTEVLKRIEIPTPWGGKRNVDEYQVLYRLDNFKTISPIENKSPMGPGQRVSTHRWTSRLSLDRARNLNELLLETEPEWRLYEDLKENGIGFRVEAGNVEVVDPENPAGRAWFVLQNGTRIRYAGASGFLLKTIIGKNEYIAREQDLIKKFV